MYESTRVARTSTRDALSALDALAARTDWHLERTAASGELRGAGAPASLVDAVRAIAPIVRRATLTGRFVGAQLRFNVSSAGQLGPARGSDADLSEIFDVEDVSDARLAWAGDADAAFRLPGTWDCRIELRWAQTLESADATTQWLVFEKLADLHDYLRAQPFWQLADALDTTLGTVALVRALAPSAILTCAVLTVASLDADEVPVPAAQPASSAFDVDPLLVRSIAPKLLAPALVTPDTEPTSGVLWTLAATTAWAHLATSLSQSGPNGDLAAEYFGLQRVRHVLPATGIPADRTDARNAVNLLSWVEEASSTDRLLAVRQVVSLRTDVPPWHDAGDIRSATEPIFLALRAEAIAEALKALRDARTAALEVARDTAAAATALAKTTVERSLATLVVLGGVIAAQTTGNLTVGQASDLRLLMAIGLFGLALWNISIERPPLFRTMSDFERDLPALSELLPMADQDRVKTLASLRGARSQARRISWVVPCLYVTLGVVALSVQR